MRSQLLNESYDISSILLGERALASFYAYYLQIFIKSYLV